MGYVEMLDTIVSGSVIERVKLATCIQVLPDDVLQALAQDEDWQVRCWVTRRKSLPDGVLQTLLQDKEPNVRYWFSSMRHSLVR